MPRLTTRSMFAAAALAAASMHAHAAIDFGGAPDGYGVVQTFSGVDGTPSNGSRWFANEDESVRTNWANERITFDASALPEDQYLIGITVRNGGSLPLNSSYDYFKVDVRLDDSLLQSNAQIAASDTEWQTLWLDAGQLSGDVSLELKWRNDNYKAGVYDANITFGAVTFAGASIPAPNTLVPAFLGGVLACRRKRR